MRRWRWTSARRAVNLRPGSLPALGLLALALAADFRPADGRTLLREYRGLDFNQAFVRAWCALLCGEVDSVLRFIEDSRLDLQCVPRDAATRTNRETWTHYMEDCRARRRTVEEPAADLRAWHFIQYGAAILTASPDRPTAGGRFTATWKSAAEAEVVRRLLNAEGETSASAVGAIAFYAERAWDLKGRRPAVPRERFRRDSPVATLASWRGYV